MGRSGRWVAAVGLVAALLGTQGSFIVYHLLDDVTGSLPVSEKFFGMPLVSRWVPLAIGATLGISLLASLFGATLGSFGGSLVAAGGVAVLPLPMMQAVGGLGYNSTFGLGTGYYIMIAGCAVAAIGSAIDVRRRLARVLPPGV